MLKGLSIFDISQLLDHCAVIGTDLECRVAYLGPGAERCVPCEQAEAYGTPLWSLSPELFGPLRDGAWREVARCGEIFEYEVPSPFGDGPARSAVRVGEMTGLHRRPGGFFMALQACHEAASGDRGDWALSGCRPPALQECDPDGVVTYSNRAFDHLLGLGRGEFVGRPVWACLEDDEKRQELKAYLDSLRRGQIRPRPLQMRNLTADGRCLDLEASWTYRRRPDGRLSGFLAVLRDVTERVRAERALRLEFEQAQRYLDNVHVVIVVLDPSGRVEQINRKGLDLLGYAEHEVVGRDWFELSTPESGRALARRRFERLKAGRAPDAASYEEAVAPRGGQHRLISWHNRILYDDEGQITGALSAGTDVTERARTEKALRKRLGFERIISNLAKRFMMVGASEIDRVIDEALMEIGRFVGADRSYLFRFYDACTRMSNTHEWCAEGIEAFKDHIQELSTEGFMWHLERLMAQGVVYIADVSAMPEEASVLRDELELQGVKSLINVALRWGGEMKAMIGLDAVRSRIAWPEEDIALLSTAAAMVSSALERQEAEAELHRAAAVFANTREGVTITGTEGRIVAVNRAFVDITGFSRGEVLQKSPRILKSGMHPASFYATLWQTLRSTGQWQGEIWNRRKSGEVFPAWLTISEVRNEVGEAASYVAVFSDITLIKRSQAQLEYMAHHDSLTDLPNRVLFNDRLGHAMQRPERSGLRLAVMFLDLDNFKNVNDSLGHAAGDLLLQAAAGRLQQQMRRGDTVARVGGDEFTVLLEEVSGSQEVGVVAEKVKAAFAEPFELIDGREVYASASIGISVYPDDASDIESLLRNADTAMYRAKEQGRNAYQFYASEMTTRAFQRLVLETSLRRALQNCEFELFYQPQVCLGSGRLTGAEALIRWRHPQLGLVAPSQFIPLAEENGLISALGEWVLGAACQQLCEWRQDHGFKGQIAVNLSGCQVVRGDIVKTVAQVIAQSGIPPDRLVLELTESFIMSEATKAIAALNGLRDQGVGLATDDFGTGYSSLSYLKQLPVDRLKIDRSFVRDLPTNADDSAIARAIIALGQIMQLKVVAEGVEKAEQAAFLREIGCDQAQGYYYSPPVDGAEFLDLMGGRVIAQ